MISLRPITMDKGSLATLIMDKGSLATLIDAYADAKSSRNAHLIRSMAAQLEQALNEVFPDTEVFMDTGEVEKAPVPDSEF